MILWQITHAIFTLVTNFSLVVFQLVRTPLSRIKAPLIGQELPILWQHGETELSSEYEVFILAPYITYVVIEVLNKANTLQQNRYSD
jgi:hypothetical protein